MTLRRPGEAIAVSAILAPLTFDEIWASFQPAEGQRKEVLVRATPAK